MVLCPKRVTRTFGGRRVSFVPSQGILSDKAFAETKSFESSAPLRSGSRRNIAIGTTDVSPIGEARSSGTAAVAAL